VDESDLPAFGLTEDDADLLWNPQQPSRTPAAFRAAREQLTALHPTYLRLLVDWAALQPDAGRAPDLAARNSGCARQVGPCGAYAGIAEELAAIASQQRAAPGSGAGVGGARSDRLRARGCRRLRPAAAPGGDRRLPGADPVAARARRARGGGARMVEPLE
jgi:hypothetical protein